MAFAAPLALVAGVIGGGITAAGQLEAGQATANAATYRAQVARNNTDISNQNAVYAEQAGQAKATAQAMKGAQVAGKIKAGQGASGVDVNSGSNVAVQAGQREVAKLDTETVLNNAQLEAYGYRTRATSDEAQAGLEQLTAEQAPVGAEIGAAGSLLSSASSLGYKWSTGGSGNPFSGGITVPGFNPIAGVSGQ